MKIISNIFYFQIIFLFISTFITAQDTFTRIDSILVPEIENCGFGEIIAGVDFDGDNMVEIYAVNNMNDLGGNELIPRIYKYEFDGENWQLVWDETSRDIPKQNSWAPTTYGDWDNDGKQEIIWAPANNLDSENTNPPRILVWESNGNDKLGRANFGFETPNAQWSITDQDNFEVRPFRMILNDINDDGNQELVFIDRRENYRFGVISISDIPDNGGGGEEWIMETSGLNTSINESTIYDMAIIGNTIYLIHSDGSITPVKYENNNYTILENVIDVIPGGSWKSATTVDMNNDGDFEVVIAGWQIEKERVHNKVFLLQEDDENIILASKIANFESLIDSAGRINGGRDAVGDIDNDGNLDFVFGTRGANPAVAIVRMEYLGGSITDSNNYEISIIDSLYPTANPGRYDVVSLANLDDDPELEILYTNGITCERFPIVILDLNKPVSVGGNTIPNSFILEQNYPNPFNPKTSISFSLPNNSEVSLKVFNTLGENIAVILNKEVLSKGNYSYKFDGINLPSGVYFYTLESSFGILTKKMIYLK